MFFHSVTNNLQLSSANEAEVHFSSRVSNSPADVGGCWYNNSHIFTTDIFPFDRKLALLHFF